MLCSDKCSHVHKPQNNYAEQKKSDKSKYIMCDFKHIQLWKNANSEILGIRALTYEFSGNITQLLTTHLNLITPEKTLYPKKVT